MCTCESGHDTCPVDELGRCALCGRQPMWLRQIHAMPPVTLDDLMNDFAAYDRDPGQRGDE